MRNKYVSICLDYCLILVKWKLYQNGLSCDLTYDTEQRRGLGRFMFHILSLSKQRAPKTTSAGNLKPDHYHPTYPPFLVTGSEIMTLVV